MDQWKHGVKNMSKYVLSVDPGKATGIALLYLAKDEEPEIIYSGETQPDEFAGVIRHLLEDFTEDYNTLIVVCEKFTIKCSNSPKLSGSI